MFTFIEFSRKQTFTVYKHCLLCNIKGKPKQATGSERIQSVLCEDMLNECMKRIIVVSISLL